MNKLQVFQLFFIFALSINMANADIIELPLDCTGEYNTSDPWTAEIDFGVQFSEISNIYIEWRGEITAQEDYIEPHFMAFLSETGNFEIIGITSIAGGSATYPNPEPFDHQSVFMAEDPSKEPPGLSAADWSMLCNGQATIGVFFFDGIHPMGTGAATIGTGRIDSAALVIDGVVVPEPTTFALLGISCIFLRKNDDQ